MLPARVSRKHNRAEGHKLVAHVQWLRSAEARRRREHAARREHEADVRERQFAPERMPVHRPVDGRRRRHVRRNLARNEGVRQRRQGSVRENASARPVTRFS